jgi:hypothetical protein
MRREDQLKDQAGCSTVPKLASNQRSEPELAARRAGSVKSANVGQHHLPAPSLALIITYTRPGLEKRHRLQPTPRPVRLQMRRSRAQLGPERALTLPCLLF